MGKYRFVCGKVRRISKNLEIMIELFGDIEACLHACPNKKIAGDVNNCPHFRKYWMKKMNL